MKCHEVSFGFWVRLLQVSVFMTGLGVRKKQGVESSAEPYTFLDNRKFSNMKGGFRGGLHIGEWGSVLKPRQSRA